MDPWEKMARWCAENAHKTHAAIREPVGADELGAANRGTGGLIWPPDVLAFYEWCDGTERTPAGYLFPRYRPMSLSEIVTTWRMCMSITYPQAESWLALPEATQGQRFAQLAADVTAGDPRITAPAGTEAGLFVPPWLPFAEDQSGMYLMIDRRRGPRSGCVVEVDAVDGDYGSKRWSSLTELADHAARALEQPSGEFRVLATGGRLTWWR